MSDRAADAGAVMLAERLAIPGVDAVIAFRVPLATRFRGVTERQGLLLHGPSGWGEWSPFDEYDDEISSVWLAAALDAAVTPAPPALRDRVPVNVTVPAVGPEQARILVTAAGCTTAKVKVAEPGGSLADDVARVAAVRVALGPQGRIRVDANAGWSVEQAVEAIGRLEEAAGGLEYAEQPCATLEELAEVRERSGVPLAADEAIRRDHADAELLREVVDFAIVKVQPSGGVTAALGLIGCLGLPTVVSSALETSVGLAAGLRLAAALPTLDHACGLATGLLLAEDVVVDPLRPDAGSLGVSEVMDLTLRRPVPSPSPDRIEWLVERAARSFAFGVHLGAEGGAR